MERTELSLRMTNSSSPEPAVSAGRRKEHIAWADPASAAAAAVCQNIDLQLNDPLPLDWEQCLDLHSGSMYYLNRKTMRRSWVKPREQSMDLELNISTFAGAETPSNAAGTAQEWQWQYGSSSGRMVALVCVNCHLLVMLCRSSPACPNCKYLHSLDLSSPPPWKLEAAAEPLETLSLLH